MPRLNVKTKLPQIKNLFVENLIKDHEFQLNLEVAHRKEEHKFKSEIIIVKLRLQASLPWPVIK
jgi:hypothetical protein